MLYKLNRTGPRTVPCSTPNGRCGGQDSVPGILMLWCLSEKYDLNHEELCQKCQNGSKITSGACLLISETMPFVCARNV